MFLVEVACHGVPSQFVWKEYLEYLQKKKRGKVKDVQFRYKNPSWQRYDIKIEFDNSKQYQKRASEDLYMRGFIQNLYLRPSCYSCKHKINNSFGDITLADFWGVHNILPELNDDKGVSLVVTHTVKGADFFEKIKAKLKIQEVMLDEAVVNNPSLIALSKMNPKSKDFIFDIKEKGVYEVLRKYCDISLKRKILRKIKRLVYRIWNK